ncbi:MAG: MFS transporter [Pseudomonadales bacterium]
MCFLMVLSHGAYYAFFSLLMEQYQRSHTTIGLLWSLGVLAEMLLFWYMHRLLPVLVCVQPAVAWRLPQYAGCYWPYFRSHCW